MEAKRIKCGSCGKTKEHPFCCDKPMELKNASWTCTHCKKSKDISCCDETMVPETDNDIDLPEEIVEELEESFEEDDLRPSKKDRPSYIG